MTTLVLDIGGTHIKFRTQRQRSPVKIESGPKMTPGEMMKAVRSATAEWAYERVSIGYPGPVIHNLPLRDPANLGAGWLKFNFHKAFAGKPVRLMNDAAMQALGSYEGKRMLFLGLGTGLGSAMVVDGVVEAMEIAHLPWKKDKTYEEYLGAPALEKNGKKHWAKDVVKAIKQLSSVLQSDYVVIGGGNAKLLQEMPTNVRLGSNGNAFKGGFLLWNTRQT